MKYKLQDLIDIEQFHYLQDRLNEIFPFPSAILDNDGNILTATGWQDICTQFHRKNNDCERDCIQSDQYILSHLHEANPAVTYHCPRGLVDNATPIIIDGIHYGNFFTGQFFLEKPDMEFFRAQAKKYGFDEGAYLEAVKKAPIWTQEQLNSYIFFIKGLIDIISESGLKKLKEIETRKQIEEIEERANTILHQMHDGFWITNMQGGQIVDTNDAMCRMLGYTRDEMSKMSVTDVEANDSPEVIAQRIQHVIQSGSAHFESRFRCKDGTIIDVDVSVTYSPERNLFFGFYRDISERVRAEAELGVLLEIMQGLAVTQDLHEFLSLIHRAIARVMYAENFFVVFYNKDSGLFEEVYIVDQYDLPAPPSKLEKSITAYVFGSGEPLLLTHAGFEKLAAQGDMELVGTNSACWLGTPLNTPDGTVGVMAIQDYENPDRFSMRDRDFLASIGSQVALAIERKRAEEALRESDAILTKAQQIAHIGSWELDYATHELRWSDETFRIFGYEPRAVSPTMELFSQSLHPEDRSFMQEAITAAWDQRTPFSEEHRIILPDGEERIVHEQAEMMYDDADQPEKWMGIVQDITERKLAEEAQHKAETNYRSVFENATIGIYQSSPEGYYLSVNPTLACIYGYDSPEDMLTNITNIDTQIYVDPSFRHEFQRQLAEQGVVTEFVSENYRKDSSLIWAMTSARAVKDTQGQILYYEGYITDITERKRAEIQMQAVQTELQRLLAESNQSRRALLSVVEDQKRAEEEKEKLQEYLIQSQKMESVGLLAGGVAHDFNNLLGVIMGHAETALAQITPHQAGYQDLQEIFKAAQRSADLTSQLLAFARKQTIRPVMLNLNDTVASMLKMLKRMIGEDIELIWRPGSDLKSVKIDPSQVDQLLANLLVNARDALSGEGQIMIETSNVTLNEADCAQYAGLFAGEYTLLTVSDSGSGMDQETLSHLFEPFFTTKEVGKGTGLGLATVFGIVKQNNGNIYVASQPGKGTTFKIYLPSYDVKVLPASPVERSETRLAGAETILMVEDEETLLELGQEALVKLGYVILAATTPAEALRIAQEGRAIHLLITDVVMPGMNGKKLAEQINLLQPGLKCLFMSGYSSEIIGDQGVLGEDVFFIQKPFLLKDLAAKVRQVLEKGVIE